MAGETHAGMQCAEFEALLSDALDGSLSGAQREKFFSHRQQCPLCGPLFAEAEAGQRLLNSLPEVEPPANLVRNIVLATTGVPARAATVQPAKGPWIEVAQTWVAGVFAPIWGTVRQPRFAMSFAMVFFSISIALNLAGVKVSSIRNVDLRPSAVVRGYYATSARVVKYYENIRFVYEIESRVRDLQRATEPEENPRPREKNHKNNSSQAPDRKREQNYSRHESQPVLALYPADTSRPWPVPALRRDS